MKYDIDNQSRLSKAFQVRDQGLQVVKPGQKVTFDLRDDPSPQAIAAHGKAGVVLTLAVEEQPVEPRQGTRRGRTAVASEHDHGE